MPHVEIKERVVNGQPMDELYIDGEQWHSAHMGDRQLFIDAAAGKTEHYSSAKGVVLVAGYGLGGSTLTLSLMKAVTRVVTIEKHTAVLKACLDRYGKLHGDEIIVGDFNTHDFNGRQFDGIEWDIWPESFLKEDVVPGYIQLLARSQYLLKPRGRLFVHNESKIQEWMNHDSSVE